MLDPVRIGPRTLCAAPSHAVWKTNGVGTWRALWAKFFDSSIGEGAAAYSWVTLGLPGTSPYGRGEVWNNNFRYQQPAIDDMGDRTSWAGRGEMTGIALAGGLYVTPPARLPMIGE